MSECFLRHTSAADLPLSSPDLSGCRHWRFILENVDRVAVPALIQSMDALVQDTKADLDSLIEVEVRFPPLPQILVAGSLPKA